MTVGRGVVLLLAGCGVQGATSPDAGPPPWGIAVGQVDVDGVFRGLDEDADLPLDVLANGTALASVALRADAAPGADADVDVLVAIDDLVIGGSLVHRAEAFAPDGSAWLLDGFRLTFSVYPCCFACRDVDVSVEIADPGGQRWTGGGRGRFVRDGCPDADLCCASEALCPGGLGTVCS